ncbi:Coatomer beta subunit [Parasponia andersonii]|uniref:Coatomer beta subunit n=1 Tax=Parasponia andersonii TaxID=3476 RepID=A0A2P5CS19_PARAD|nr:Coatomer beta subunit [Parasponia andersonii]
MEEEDYKEFEKLFDDIPHETSHNVHHQHDHNHHHKNVHGGHAHRSYVKQTINGVSGMCDDDPFSHYKSTSVSSPVSVFSLQSNGSSSSLFSAANSLSDNGSPTPPSVEELKSQKSFGTSHCPNRSWLDPKTRDSPLMNRRNTNGRLIDELGLCRNLGKMYISDEEQDYSSSGGFWAADQGGIWIGDGSLNGNYRSNAEHYADYKNPSGGFSDSVGFQSSVPGNAVSSSVLGLQQGHRIGNLRSSQLSNSESSSLFSEFNGYTPMSSLKKKAMEQTSNYHPIRNPVSKRATTIGRMSSADASFYLPPNGTEDTVFLNSLNYPEVTQTRRPHWNVDSLVYKGLPTTDGRTRPSSNIRIGTSEDSFIIQGEALNYVVNSRLSCFDRARGRIRSALRDFGMSLERSRQDGRHHIAGSYENSQNCRVFSPFSVPTKYNSLAEVEGYIGSIAKDQHGCRFLQTMLLEGTPDDVQTIYNEIIEHVVELMMNQFGNYLMQKLLDVCNEEQRKQILVMVAAQPGELVKISMDSHGTRVVQKLIDTLKTRQQISLIISALEPGFLALIKDSNGNHVVQRCLQCLSKEDNKFIFDAAARYCVEIGTHQHGCCVLQRCISHASGKHRENLVAEVSSNALLLAQDAYGNYVVQFILELRIPSAVSTVVSQFEGNYVHLSMQKFSSHVVEKCLIVMDDDIRSRIIRELLDSLLFELLLRDSSANYVIQTALRVSKGALRKLLVEAIEPHKSLSRNNPYLKRIFSSKLLKK